MPQFEPVEWAILFALSLILPISIFFGRGNIRKRRLAVLHDLEQNAFRISKEGDGGSLPYIDVVRARYEQSGFGHYGNQASLRKIIQGYASEAISYLLPTSIFVILSAMGIYLVLIALHYTFDNPNLFMNPLSRSTEPGIEASYRASTALIISAAFLGAYIWSINYLILRVANFDLTPLDFLRVSAHLLLTSVIAGVLRHAAHATTGWDFTVAIVLLIAIMMGLFPSLGLNILVDRLPPSLRIKRAVPEANQIGREFPLDLIDGVDTGIKFRLANYEINDAQNLATENPIGLYVATPYNLLEIMDWVAQAQLLITLGPSKYLAAREKTIRDIHGLLRLGATPQGAELLAQLLGVPKEVVGAKLESIAADLHVQRLTHLRGIIASSMQAQPRSTVRLAAE
jgi:hypothetical protein